MGGQVGQQSKGGGPGLEPDPSGSNPGSATHKLCDLSFPICKMGILIVPASELELCLVLETFLQEATVHPLSLWTGKGPSGPARHLAPVLVSLRASRGFLTAPEVWVARVPLCGTFTKHHWPSDMTT